MQIFRHCWMLARSSSMLDLAASRDGPFVELWRGASAGSASRSCRTSCKSFLVNPINDLYSLRSSMVIFTLRLRGISFIQRTEKAILQIGITKRNGNGSFVPCYQIRETRDILASPGKLEPVSKTIARLSGTSRTLVDRRRKLFAGFATV